MLAAILLSVGLLQDPGPEGEIAFMKNGWVWVHDLASQESRRVAESEFDRPLRWSPDGSRLLYWNHDAGWNVWEWNVDEDRVRNLSNRNGWDCRFPSYSPDARYIAFMTGAHGLCVMGSGGNGLQVLSSKGFRDQGPSWSPDSSKILFTDEDGGHFTMHLMDVKSGRIDALGKGMDASFSPSGSTIVFASGGEIVAAAPDGSARKQLTKTRDWTESEPQWSRDGKWIAYRRFTSQDEELCVMKADGSESKTVVEFRREGWHAFTWSPKGDWLAYSTGTRAEEQLYVISVRGGEPIELEDGGAVWPAWRPTPTPPSEPPALRLRRARS